MKANVDIKNGKLAQHLESIGTIYSARPYIASDGNAYMSVPTGYDEKGQRIYKAVPTNYATLRYDEWKAIDEAVLKTAKSRLVAIQDLIDKGLVFNIGDGMSSTVLQWETVGEALSADISMDGTSRGKNDRLTYSTNYLPLPIIHADFTLNARVLNMSRKIGMALDTSMSEEAARAVAVKLESMLTQNVTYSYGGGTIYSYINHPARNTYTITTAWDASGKTGADIVNDVLAMKQILINKHFYGPYALYVPTNYETVLDKDYDTTRGNTIRERILQIGNITDVKVIDSLPSDNVVLVQLTQDVVRLVRGLGITTIEWGAEGNLVNNYKVLTIQVPQIRADKNGSCGIVHGATS